jgi:hypothetical protein
MGCRPWNALLAAQSIHAAWLLSRLPSSSHVLAAVVAAVGLAWPARSVRARTLAWQRAWWEEDDLPRVAAWERRRAWRFVLWHVVFFIVALLTGTYVRQG